MAEVSEQTILAKTEELLKYVADLEARIDGRFKRNSDLQSDAAEKPQSLNILDEIAGNIDDASLRLNQLTSFIQTEVLNKIN